MRFKVTGSLSYEVNSPATIIASLHAMQTHGQHVYDESFTVSMRSHAEVLATGLGQNRFARLSLDSNGPLTLEYSAEVRTTVLQVSQQDLLRQGPDQLRPDVIPFLFPSRYCQSDMLRTEAADLFGNYDSTYHQVEAIAQWISDNVNYVVGSTNEQSSAVDILQQREGVCRDFAHLGVALCRALTIPARYTTVYAYQLTPQDFHACFEANIGGRWFIFDPTGLAPLNGLVRISIGRDASDTAVASLFGNIQGSGLSVDCQSLEKNFQPIDRDELHRSNTALILQ